MRVAALPVAFGLLGLTPALATDGAKERVAPISEACPGKPGFVRIPGTRSCTRLSGRVTTDVGVTGNRTLTAPDVAGRIAIDNRTDSDFGEIRTYVRVGNGHR